MRWRRFPWAFPAILLALCTSCAPLRPSITIGALYPTTGPQATGGVEEYRGVQLAAELANREGGVRGRRIQLDLRPAASAEGVPDAMHQLARDGVPVVVGSNGSTLSAVAARAAAFRNIVFWETGAVGDMPGRIPRNDRFFRVAPTGRLLGRDAVDFVERELLPRLGRTSATYGVAYVDDEYGHAVGGGALEEARRLGKRTAAFPYSIPPKAARQTPWGAESGPSYDLPQQEFDAIADRVKSEGVDVLVVGAYVDDGVALRRAIVRRKVPLLANIGTSSSYCMPAFGRALGGDAVGVFASDKPDAGVLRTSVLTPEARRSFRWAAAAYRARYHATMPAPALAGFAGAWALFHDVLPKAASDRPADIARAARAVDLPFGALPNASGLRFVVSGGGNENARAASVIEEWVAPRHREVVWPPAFATGRLVLPAPAAPAR